MIAQPPIPYVPPADLHKKWEPKLIKVKLPGRTNSQMSAYGIGNNEEHLVHIIAIMHLIEQKGTTQDVKKAFEVLVELRREMQPLLEFPDNKMEIKKEERKNKLLEFKKTQRPSANLRLQRPRWRMSYSVALLLARCKRNGTRL